MTDAEKMVIITNNILKQEYRNDQLYIWEKEIYIIDDLICHIMDLDIQEISNLIKENNIRLAELQDIEIILTVQIDKSIFYVANLEGYGIYVVMASPKIGYEAWYRLDEMDFNHEITRRVMEIKKDGNTN